MILCDRIQILDTTLRDGSYVVDFQFTARDTEILARALDRLGVHLIEVGHGMGMGASAHHQAAASSDTGYIEAAKKAVTQAKIGMFCIPGLATCEGLRDCVSAGLDFVRIGSDVNRVAETAPFIEEARKLGVFVCTNFMKSYAMPVRDFVRVVRTSESYGSQMVYLVDSAGSMLPRMIREYVRAIRGVTALPIGFHGHNNLMLAVSNSLAAVESGATVIDTTLLGIGRSSGNVPTEIMIPLLQRCFTACLELEPLLFLDLAEQVITPLVQNRFENAERVALGLAGVHSQYAGVLRQKAADQGKLFYSLVAEVGRRNQLELSDKVLKVAMQKAMQVNQLSEVLGGGVSLIETLEPDASVEDIVRVAIKLNVPIDICLIEGTARENVVMTREHVVVAARPPRALALLGHTDTARKKVIMGDRVLACSPELLEQIRGMAGENQDGQ